MTEKNPTQNAMDKILQGEVKQIPRWHFVVKNIALWIVGFACVIAGALTVSLVIFTFANSAFTFRDIAKYNFLQHIMIVLPVLWIAITIIFAVLFDLFVRHTKKGYKYSLSMIITVNVVLSIIVGSLFYFFGISHVVDDILDEHFRSYHSVEKRQARLFDNPENGIIIGQIINCEDDYFTIVTPDNTQWRVINKYIPELKHSKISDGQRFVIIGKKLDNNIFVACDIRGRGIAGGNGQLRQRHFKKMQEMHNECTQECVDDMKKIPENIEVMIQTACAHLK